MCKLVCEARLKYTWWLLQLFVAAIFLTHTALHLHRLIMYFMTSKIGLAGGRFSKPATSDPQWKPRRNYINKIKYSAFQKSIMIDVTLTNTRYWEITYQCKWRYRYLHSLVHFHCLFGILLVLQIHSPYKLVAREILGWKNSESISSRCLKHIQLIIDWIIMILSTILMVNFIYTSWQ